MSLLASYIVPHPPLAVPEVGRGEERGIQSTIDGYRTVAERIASLKPETIIVISPHTAYFSDWIYMAGGSHASGTLAQFRAPEVKLDLQYDVDLRSAIELDAAKKGIPAGTVNDSSKDLDHGMMVPLSYLDKVYPSDRYKAVSIGGSAVPRSELLEFGRCIVRAIEQLDRRAILLVSGDLSHKLKEDGPYGFNAAGPEFDAAFVRVIESGDPKAFSEIDPQICEDAAECGLSGFIMMAGALEEAKLASSLSYTSQLLSYEGPFGVGYGIASFEREDSESVGEDGEETQIEADDTVCSIESQDEEKSDSFTKDNAALSGVSEDPLVRLAWDTVRLYVTNHTLPDAPPLPDDIPAKAGCFVSIHVVSTGELRGCIGTIEPVQETLALEIIANAVSASTRDPRFPAISPDELDDLRINVDVLFEPEPAVFEDLDPKRYGVIVSQGYKRGLLLPDLEGVDTPEEQVRIACMKAGIDPRDALTLIRLERFEVIRHE